MSALQYFVTLSGLMLIVSMIDAVVLTCIEARFGRGGFVAKAFGRPCEALLALYAAHTIVIGWTR